MRILHINSYYSTSKFYKNLYDTQINNDLNIDVYIPVSLNFKVNDFDYGIYTKISRNYREFDRLIFSIKHHKIYKDIQKKYNLSKYSIVHAHSLFSNGCIAMKIKKKYGVPYIVAVRNTDVNLFFKKMIHLRKLGIEILNEASSIIFLSESYKKHVIDRYIPQNFKKNINSKSFIIPNGIDKFWFKNLGTTKKRPNRYSLRLLHIGDININKNVIATIKAIDILFERGYEVKLDVVGKVVDRKIFNKIKKLDHINYLGYKSKEELVEIYRDNDIFVLPSIYETFGLVYAEAISQGLPVIYTKGQGFDEQFEDGQVGHRVDCYNIDEIADKIVEINNSYAAMSKRCVTLCKKFDWNKISIKYLKIYSKIINLDM